MAALVYPTHPEMASAHSRGAPPLQTMFCNLRSLAFLSFSFTDSRKKKLVYYLQSVKTVSQREVGIGGQKAQLDQAVDGSLHFSRIILTNREAMADP